MLRAYKYRIYPTEQQQSLLTQQFGIGRFVYNWVLDRKQKEYAARKAWEENPVGEKPKYKTRFDYCKILTALKSELSWVGDANAQALQQEIAHLFYAYDRFYKNLKERKARKQKITNKQGRLLDFPKFKSRKDRQSLSFPQAANVDFESSMVQIPKLGKVPCIFHREFTGAIKTTTISKTVTGKYFVSILIEDGKELPEPIQPDQSGAVGIDVGLTHCARSLTNGQTSCIKQRTNSFAKAKQRHSVWKI